MRLGETFPEVHTDNGSHRVSYIAAGESVPAQMEIRRAQGIVRRWCCLDNEGGAGLMETSCD